MKKLKIQLNIALALMLFLSCSIAFAEDDIKMAEPTDTQAISNEYDSIYRYNALESKVSYAALDTVDTVTTEAEPQFEAIAPTKQEGLEKKSEEIMGKNQSNLKTFMVGNRYTIGNLRFELVQIKDSIYKLTLLSQTANNVDKIELNHQIDFLVQEQKKIENFITEQESKFSLFGWLVGIL